MSKVEDVAPPDLVPGDVVVRDFSGNYLIWRILEQMGSRREGLGQTKDRALALERADKYAGSTHHVWFCDSYGKHRKIR